MIDLNTRKTALMRGIWAPDLAAMPAWRAWPLRGARIAYAVGRDLAEGGLSLRAMSLVYTTLLSLVPLLAISFSVLKGFGVHNQVEPALLSLLAPFGAQGAEIAARIVDFVDNVRVGVLGSVGLALLVYTVISLMQKIERALNYVWHVQQERSWGQRFSSYLSVVVVGPVLIFASVGVTASVTGMAGEGGALSTLPLSAVLELIGRVVPYLMVIGAFTFIYAFMPNTRVRLVSALAGGIAAGILWESMGWAFAAYVVGSAKYSAIYSAFATLIIFMIWLYLGWLVLLVGASVSFYHQNPDRMRAGRGADGIANRDRERLALLVAALVARSYAEGAGPVAPAALVEIARCPPFRLTPVIDTLTGAGILVAGGPAGAGLLPARPPDAIAVADILDAIRGAYEPAGDPALSPPTPFADPGVDGAMAEIETAMAAALSGMTLADLAKPASALRPVGEGRA